MMLLIVLACELLPFFVCKWPWRAFALSSYLFLFRFGRSPPGRLKNASCASLSRYFSAAVLRLGCGVSSCLLSPVVAESP